MNPAREVLKTVYFPVAVTIYTGGYKSSGLPLLVSAKYQFEVGDDGCGVVYLAHY